MGTFHQGKHQLHGITVVVDTDGEEVWIGRCDDVVGEVVILRDADGHRDGEGGRSKAEWVARAARFGVWSRYPRLEVPRASVTSITPLGELG